MCVSICKQTRRMSRSRHVVNSKTESQATLGLHVQGKNGQSRIEFHISDGVQCIHLGRSSSRPFSRAVLT